MSTVDWTASKVTVTDAAEARQYVTAILRSLFPHGHAEYIPLLLDEAQLHSDKNHDYAGPHGTDPLGNFKRRAALYALYPGLDLSDPATVAVVDLLKQLDAYLWLKANGHAARVEGKDARLRDVSVYADLARLLDREEATREHAPAVPADLRAGDSRCPQSSVVTESGPVVGRACPAGWPGCDPVPA